jgi:mycothiol synthase
MADPLLPTRYQARRGTPDAVPAIAEFLRAVSIAESGRPAWSVDDLANWWSDESFDVTRDVVVAHDVDGAMVAVEFLMYSEPHVAAHGIGGIDPGHAGRGLGWSLLAWARNHAVNRLSLAPDGAKVVFDSWIFAAHQPSIALMTDFGLEFVRQFLDMEIDLADAQPTPPVWPAGVTVRTFGPGTDDAELSAMLAAAFADHYGNAPVDPEVDLRRLRRDFRHPDFDPALWWLAEADGRIVGASLCLPKNEGDPEVGYVDAFAVLREWRGRGVGLALLLHSFEQFRARGKRGVALGVDASSLTGATRLYERAGMHEVNRVASYATTIRDGVELRTMGLG